MFTCTATWNWRCFNKEIVTFTNCTLLMEKYSDIFFKISLRASISELLNAFNKSNFRINREYNKKFYEAMFEGSYIELQLLSICVMYG